MGTVCVACKVPNGLRIGGANKSALLVGSAQVPIQERVGGYALTENVDAECWAAWVKDHADSELVQNNIVFAEDNLATLRARAWARSRIQGWNGKGPHT